MTKKNIILLRLIGIIFLLMNAVLSIYSNNFLAFIFILMNLFLLLRIYDLEKDLEYCTDAYFKQKMRCFLRGGKKHAKPIR